MQTTYWWNHIPCFIFGCNKCTSERCFLYILAHRPRPTLRADRTAIPVGGAVTLICSVEGSTGWKYEWFRRTSDSDEEMVLADGNGMENLISVAQAGIYWCRGRRGNPIFFTEQSDVSRIEITRTFFRTTCIHHMSNKLSTEKYQVFSVNSFDFYLNVNCGVNSAQQDLCDSATQLDSDIQWWGFCCHMSDGGRRRHWVGVWVENNQPKHTSRTQWIQDKPCFCFPQRTVLVQG